jgi:CRISPR/Cas system-associated endonuclease Cas3-HD
MNQRLQTRSAPAPVLAKAISTPVEARKLAEDLMDVMSALLGIIERETELVRAGKLRDAMRLEEQKGELSRRYTVAVENLKNAQKYLRQVSPELLAMLQRQHDTFRAMLQINLTVLATAHAVSEGLVRGVNTEIQRKNIPNTYTASGRRAAPGPRNITPLAVSRSL